MSRAISYSLFGYNRERSENCFDFNSYFRNMMVSIRMNRLIYPEWVNIIHLDKSTADGFPEFFAALAATPNVIIKVEADAPLTKAMLWRMKPCFDPTYSHVICRDIESPSTYREAQAVSQWIAADKACHAITDSVSHTIPLMGGMIGFVPKYFTMRTGWNSWEEMMHGQDYPWDVKGSDQEFLNAKVYPKFAQPGNDSITQHYFNGVGNTFLSDYHACSCPPTSGHSEGCVNNIAIPIPNELKESNSICGHIGAAGFYEAPTFRFLRKYWGQFNDLLEVEKIHPQIFYWVKES